MQAQGLSAGHLRPPEPRRVGCPQAALVHLHRSPQEGLLSPVSASEAGGQGVQERRCDAVRDPRLISPAVQRGGGAYRRESEGEGSGHLHPVSSYRVVEQHS